MEATQIVPSVKIPVGVRHLMVVSNGAPATVRQAIHQDRNRAVVSLEM